MIAFVYDDEVLLCDGDNVNGNLEGKCERLKIEEFKKMCFNNKIDNGEFEIPKRRVEQEVDNMKTWGSYDPLLNNCQDWFKELLKKLQVRDTGPYLHARTALVGGTILTAFIIAGVALFKFVPYSTPVQPKNPRSTRLQQLPY